MQAGLFSAITTGFITQMDPQLHPDPNEETAALLRILIYKIDNAAFSGDIPTLPKWTGPPRMIVCVETILYASLVTSVLSAFLATLGKQWLNRYASNDMRGSAIECSQNRQRKLDGIVSWYFDHVMESLPLMSQLALSLFGGGLSLYLWGIDITIASVVVGITSFGLIFYALIVIAGTASVSCPYQTPGAQILRHTIRHILPFVQSIIYSAFSSIINNSFCILLPISWWDSIQRDGWSVGHFFSILGYIPLLPFLLAHDAYNFVRPRIADALTLPRRMYNWVHSPQVDGSNRQVIALDLQCISWILQTSLDKAVHLSTLKSLAAMTTLVDFSPALVSACFDILASCVAVVGDKAVVTRGSEELATVSATCCLRTFSHLTAMDPTSTVLRDVGKRYTRAIPPETDFENFPAHHSFGTLHRVFYPTRRSSRLLRRLLSKIQWNDYKLPDNWHVILVQLARFKYQTRGYGKVPRWILRFALHHLSQDPPPSTSATIDWLSIIAIDMGCAVPGTDLDERYVHI